MSRHLTPGLCLLVGALFAAHAHGQDATTDTTTVTVKGKKTKVERKIDRTVYDKSDDPAAQAGTAADVLKTVPAVTVSANGDVALRGDKNVQVYVDGKPSAMMSGDSRALTLQTMAGSDIATVEVITNPGANFGGNGGGIINIVLKKNRKPGTHAIVQGNMGEVGRFNANLAGDSSHGKLSLHGRIGLRHDALIRHIFSDLTWRGSAGAGGRSVQASRNFARRRSWSTAAGLDYTVDDQDTLSLSGSYAQRHSRNPLDEFHQDYDAAGTLVDNYDRRSVGPGGQTDSTLNATFDHRRDDLHDIKLQVQHSQTVTDRDKSYRNIFAFPLQADSRDRILTRAAKRLDEVSLDYLQPLGTTAQVSAGVDIQRQQDEIYNYNAVIDDDGTETVIPGTTNRFILSGSVDAAYVTWQMTADKWTWLAGARLESQSQISKSPTSAYFAVRAYAGANPSLHLRYALDDSHDVKASFSQSLQRPDPRDLNPFVTYVDAQNISAGNPDLKPQRVRATELSYEAPSWSTTLYDRSSTRTVTDYAYFVAGDVLLTTKRNSGRGRSIGLDTVANGKIGDHFDYSGDVNLYYAELEAADLAEVLHRSGLSWSAQLDLDYNRGPDVLSLDGQFQGDSLTSQGRRSGTSAVNLTWKHQLTSCLSLVVNAQDVFRGSRQTFVTRTATVHQVGLNDLGGRSSFIGVVYKLGGL